MGNPDYSVAIVDETDNPDARVAIVGGNVVSLEGAEDGEVVTFNEATGVLVLSPVPGSETDLDGYQLRDEKGQPNGYVGLNGSAEIDSVYLPALNVFQPVEVANQAARLALPVNNDAAYLAIQTDNDSRWLLAAGDDPTVSGNWIQITFVAPVTSVDGLTGAVDLSALYAPLEGGVVPEDKITNEVLRTDDAAALYAKRVGNAVGDTDVLTLSGGTLTLDLASAILGVHTLAASPSSVVLANEPSAGTLGFYRLQVHQAASGTVYTLPSLTSLVDVWRNPEGAPTMPQTHSAILIIDVEVIEGTSYGSWSVPDIRFVTIQVTDPNGSAITTGDGKAYWAVPAGLNGYRIAAVQADLTTVSSSGAVNVDLWEVVDGVDILSTNLTIDANERSSATAATPAVIDAANDDLATGNQVRVDIDGAGTGAKGLMVHLTLYGPPV